MHFLQMGQILTVNKRDPVGNLKVCYQGKVLSHIAHEIVIRAEWTLPSRDLGYTRFEPGDIFIEYYYTDRWFNIFAIADPDGKRKGWYCNITEPAQAFIDRIEQVDLLLDVWVNPMGEPLILDEDEFNTTTTLSAQQRSGALQGLQTLLHLLKIAAEPFSSLSENPGDS